MTKIVTVQQCDSSIASEQMYNWSLTEQCECNSAAAIVRAGASVKVSARASVTASSPVIALQRCYEHNSKYYTVPSTWGMSGSWLLHLLLALLATTQSRRATKQVTKTNTQQQM